MAEIKETEVRIDVYLWSVRLFKSRSQATEACKNGKISINGYSVKPSRNIHSGVTFEMRDNPITRTYVVKQILQKRVGAKFVPEYLEETTAPDVLKRLQEITENQFITRDRGTGRPTKKDRRDMEKFGW